MPIVISMLPLMVIINVMLLRLMVLMLSMVLIDAVGFVVD